MKTATQTQTQSTTKTITKVAIGLAVIAAAAYAGYGAFANKGYQNFYVQCYSGATMSWDEHRIQIQEDPTSPAEVYKPGNPCASAQTLKDVANTFCTGKQGKSGKTGVNTFKISQRCQITEPTKNYGYNPSNYGYNTENYGYNEQQNSGNVTGQSGYGYAGNGYGYASF